MSPLKKGDLFLNVHRDFIDSVGVVLEVKDKTVLVSYKWPDDAGELRDIPFAHYLVVKAVRFLRSKTPGAIIRHGQYNAIRLVLTGRYV